MGSEIFYGALADVTAIVHLSFIVYVVLGGFLAWRWPRTIALHIAAATWGFTGLVFGIDCPLTHVESWARIHAGQSPLPSTGFIAHYLTGVIYPQSFAGLIQTLVAVAVVASWIGYVALRIRGSRAPSHPRGVGLWSRTVH
ncbi:hypothetical protein BFN03_08575 [Rhodococcus sp. WMMA185]|uniref:DUF2784 domain-containing protein n=1 Tax=Rhodococcus sp. WMMA185 TaxID=679318 RepID=UPI00087D04EF|nr:DUF2784 domain-containing protein [Rhodococcus sp. WMMA185]AOW92734.1 hypothetical protein BFN03_08575 [Rhodococcus sp. WMMA185]